jgi:hypothetical protein
LNAKLLFSKRFMMHDLGMSPGRPKAPDARIFGLQDWMRWLDVTARSLYGLSGEEFERAYKQGTIEKKGSASDLASVIPLIRRLRTLAVS